MISPAKWLCYFYPLIQHKIGFPSLLGMYIINLMGTDLTLTVN